MNFVLRVGNVVKTKSLHRPSWSLFCMIIFAMMWRFQLLGSLAGRFHPREALVITKDSGRAKHIDNPQRCAWTPGDNWKPEGQGFLPAAWIEKLQTLEQCPRRGVSLRGAEFLLIGDAFSGSAVYQAGWSIRVTLRGDCASRRPVVHS